MKRLPAKKVMVEDVVNGNYFQKEGFESNYVLTPMGRKVSRVNLLGTIMKKFINDDGDYGFIVIDDETETIRAKVFQNTSILEGIKEGQLVKVIGKVREYNDELYLNLEHVKELGDPNWLTLRLLEVYKTESDLKEKIKEIKDKDLSQEEMFNKAEKEGINKELLTESEDTEEEKEEKAQSQKKAKDNVLELIEDLDDGNGTDYSKIIEESDLDESNVEDIINDLLSEGTCYEPRPGKIKKL
ncbi:MAG: OB-fold nucleic acid binding domain-containing protein [Candidatus Aenigmatarchaeota archaeon]